MADSRRKGTTSLTTKLRRPRRRRCGPVPEVMEPRGRPDDPAGSCDVLMQRAQIVRGGRRRVIAIEVLRGQGGQRTIGLGLLDDLVDLFDERRGAQPGALVDEPGWVVRERE